MVKQEGGRISEVKDSYSANFIGLVTGLFVGALGLLLLGLGLIAVIDPTGTKMADDSDPFGTTNGIAAIGLLTIVFGIVLIAGGGYLIWRIDKEK